MTYNISSSNSSKEMANLLTKNIQFSQRKASSKASVFICLSSSQIS